MNIGIFSMKDDLNGFMNLFPEATTEMAKRGFIHALRCANQDSLFYSNPSDYSLYRLGDFNTETGEIVVFSTPEFIVRGEKYEG